MTTSTLARTPVVARTRTELADLLSAARAAGRQVGLVPTMGALHAGHGSLMDVARAEVGEGVVVVTVFVNPTQFAPGEDLDRYPRTLETDLELCAEHGVDVVFVPSVEEVYPHGPDDADSVVVDPGPSAALLEGGSRPSHFRGVLTVVAKLFGLVGPDAAVFGEKDYQQLALIRRMSADLCLGVKVIGAETVREPDGLAMSSRNRYLSVRERQQATALNRSLLRAREHAHEGIGPALAAAHAELRAAGIDPDYLEITAADLSPLPADVPSGSEGRVLVAARVGETRLIDNMAIRFGDRTDPTHPASTHTTEGVS